MIRPLTETDGDPFPPANHHSSSLGHHTIDPRYDELFEVSFTPACDAVEEVLADYDSALKAAETALIKIGMAWLHVPQSPEFVRTLAMVFALLHLVNTERTTRWDELARQRRQGRALSSAHDVYLDAEQWLDEYIEGRSPWQRGALDTAITPLTRKDVASLLDVNPHQIPRTTAQLWRARAPEEET